MASSVTVIVCLPGPCFGSPSTSMCQRPTAVLCSWGIVNALHNWDHRELWADECCVSPLFTDLLHFPPDCTSKTKFKDRIIKSFKAGTVEH